MLTSWTATPLTPDDALSQQLRGCQVRRMKVGLHVVRAAEDRMALTVGNWNHDYNLRPNHPSGMCCMGLTLTTNQPSFNAASDETDSRYGWPTRAGCSTENCWKRDSNVPGNQTPLNSPENVEVTKPVPSESQRQHIFGPFLLKSVHVFLLPAQHFAKGCVTGGVVLRRAAELVIELYEQPFLLQVVQ